MAPTVKPRHAHSKGSGSSITWRPTKIMNMRDLSKDDDFLSHLLVEKLGTGTVPLLVHKMDPTRRLPKTEASLLLGIVQHLVASRLPVHHATKQAVDELITLPPVRYYLKSFTQKQINAFATHASRYFELYHPSGSIEIAHTSRYSHRTGKSELCILATRTMAAGTVITELKGSMANLTTEEDQELKRTDLRNSDIRRDFSVIHSKQMKKNHLFLGPARFVNHDCDNNCELFREGKYITFRVIRTIQIGEEITAHYGDGYFGRRNRHCLCETCEKHGRGGYAPERNENDESGDDGSDMEYLSDSALSESGQGAEDAANSSINLNERRTRRGVYAIVQEEDDDSEESEEDEGDIPLANAPDVLSDAEIELEAPLCADVKPIRPPGAAYDPKHTPPLVNGDAPVSHLGLDTPPPSENAEEEKDEVEVPTTSDLSSLPSSRASSRLIGRGLAPGSKNSGNSLSAEADVHDPARRARNKTPLQCSTEPEDSTSSKADTKGKEKEAQRDASPEAPSRRITRSISARAPNKDVDLDSSSTRPKFQTQSSGHDPAAASRQPAMERLQQRFPHLATPPLSEDAASPGDSRHSPPVRTTRQSSLLRSVRDKATGGEKKEASRSATPAKGRDKAKPDDESEARVLRARPPAPVPQINANPRPAKPAVPRGPDGRPLPTCSTCTNILPVISVDSTVIWGLETPSHKKKKRKEKQECPRCMRHLAIYGLPWPTRASSQRQTFIPTPREDSSVVESSNRRVSQKALPTLLSKLEVAAAASASTSSIPRRRALSEERPTKRRKTEPSARGESCDNNANGSPASGQTRSGRTSLPSAKAQEGDKRKRGRPRLSSPRRQVLAAEKPMKLKSLAVLCQPRDTNGRFGKKAETNGLFMRKRHGSGGTAQRQALRDLARGVGRESSVDDDSFSTTRGGDDEESDFLHKRSRRESSPFSTGYSEFHRLPRHILPASLEAGFQATGLSFMPNPMVFARRKWAFQISSAHPNGTADDECAPTANTTSPNSEDPLSISGSPHHANAEALKSFRRSRDESRDIGHHGDITLSMGALTHKPSPASFARRRWLKCALDCDVRKPSHADRTTTSGAIGYDRFPERLISPEPSGRSLRSRRAHGLGDGSTERLVLDGGMNTSDPAHEGAAANAPTQHDDSVDDDAARASRRLASPDPTFFEFCSCDDERHTCHKAARKIVPNLHDAGWDTSSDISIDAYSDLDRQFLS